MKKSDLMNIVKEEVQLALEDIVGFKKTNSADLIGAITKHLETVNYEVLKSNFTADGAEAVVKAKDKIVYHIKVKPIANVPGKPSLADNLTEAAGPDLDALAKISDQALDAAYHYGLSKPGTFGYEANKSSAGAAANLITKGETDIEKISAAVHDGWGKIAKTYDDPAYATKPEKKQNRLKLASTPYNSLPDDEKEKDRVIARAILQAWQAKGK